MAWIKLKDLFATKKEFNAEKDKNSKEIAGLRDSISRFKIHGADEITVFVAENGDCQLRVKGVPTWLCWNDNRIFTWKA